MQQQFKFVIPQKLDDLLHPQEDPNIYYVNDELTSLEISQRLPETQDRLKLDPLSIIQEFEVFFSVLKNFNNLDSQVIGRAWQLIFKTTDAFKEQLREIFSVLNDSLSQGFNTSITRNDVNSSQTSIRMENRGNLFESFQEKMTYSNAAKMLIYLNCSFIQSFEDALSTETHRINFNESYSDAQTPAKRKKRPRQNDHTRDSSFKDYDRYKDRVMKIILQIVSFPLNKVAESPTEAREIVAHVMRICYKMIENSAINNLHKNKDLLDINFSIIGVGIEKYNQSLSFCLKFIQLLQYREQLAPLLADLVEFIVVRYNQRLIIGEILREIDRIDIRELSRDSSCPRAVSTFLITLSEKCPKDFLPSLNHIFGYLEQDSYIMRNAILSVIANLIIKVLHQSEEDKTLRDELLDVLLAHIKDITGYTRSKTLTLWCLLCENQCIPLSYITPVTKAAVGRLQDKSCFVRKSAVRFIMSILSRNPYSSRLPLKAFTEKYEEEKAILDKLLEEEKADFDKSIAKDTELDKATSQDEMSDVQSQDSANDTIVSETDVDEVQAKRVSSSLVEETAVVAQRRKVNYLQDAIAFTRQITKAIPITSELLCSKNVTDIQEAIDFFVHCHEFGIDEALIGFKRMITLINVQEKSVQDTVSSAYRKIFFDSGRYEGKSNRDSLVVTNLISFIQSASIGECISLESLIYQFVQTGVFTSDMERELWARFTQTRQNTNLEESISAIQLIGMLASQKPDIINHNLQLCVKYGLASNGCNEIESRLIRETCIAIRKSLPRKIEDKRRSMRLAKDDAIFERLQTILVESLTSMTSANWFSMCDEALRIIFDIAENPDRICQTIFTQMADALLKNSIQSNSLLGQDINRNESPDLVFQPSTIQTTTTSGSQTPTMELVHPIVLARFIHFLGDVALDLAVFLELHVLLELKIRNASSNDSSANNISAHNISISSRRRSRRYGAANKSVDDPNLEEDVGLGGAEAEDLEMEFIGSICDEEIVCGKNLLAKLSRVIIEVVTDPFRYPNPELKQTSSLALAKYMMVSAKYCNEHLRLLFTILEKTKDSEIKINLLIAISDLCIRFPNQLDGWNSKIFDCLQSEDVSVRRAALKILSRLVLCDILKAKDQISIMANLIVDDDEQISSYSRHFFLELSKKLNAIYNVLPDIISRLSDVKTGLNEENFRIVMRFLFELIDKSQHIDRLVDKLCGRFMDTDNERQWSDLAYCLSLLKYSDRSMIKLIDKFDCYKDKLCIESVMESISLAAANYRKTPHLKNEMKQMLDEFEAKIAKSAGEEKKDPEGEDQVAEEREEGEKEEEEKTIQDDSGDVTIEEAEEE